VKAYDLLELSGRNLREAMLRNSLTTLGIGVGVASLVAMLSLGIGLQRLLTKQLGKSSLFDSVFVTSRQDFRPRRPTTGTATDNTPPKPLDDAARKGFEKLPGVIEVYPSLASVAEFRVDDGQSNEPQTGVLSGLPPSSRSSEAFDDFYGQFFSGPNAHEAILKTDFARELLGLPEVRNTDVKLTPDQAAKLLGKDLVLRYAERQSQPAPAAGGLPPDPGSFNVVRKELKLKIVGIVTSEPVRGVPRTGQTSVFLPVAFAESINMIQPGDLRNIVRQNDTKTYTALIVHMAKSKDVAAAEEEIRKQGFNAFSVLDFSKGLNIAFGIVDAFLGVFGSLALAVASLGIVNTLVMAILERRREIGIMKAVGASDGDVKKIFFVEAGSMGLLGGGLGVLMGWMMGRVINWGTAAYFARQGLTSQDFWYVPLWLVAGAIVFSILVSLAAGLYPASRAAKLDPVQALRHD
jgi:putative ABC transport system permease protein